MVRRLTHKEVALHADDYDPQPPAIERELFRIAQEALNNAVKHAGATQVNVELASRHERLGRAGARTTALASIPRTLSIRTRRLGITSMEERAEELGG